MTQAMIKATKHKLPGQIKNANHGQFMDHWTIHGERNLNKWKIKNKMYEDEVKVFIG